MSHISNDTWAKLVSASKMAEEAGWACHGVFATALGQGFTPGAKDTMLYVGKSLGPRSKEVGVTSDQSASNEATTKWMLGGLNKSPFWRFADLLVPKRDCLAWSNLAKIDRANTSLPPNKKQWNEIGELCLAALRDEIESLQPWRTVFVTGSYGRNDIHNLLRDLDFGSTNTKVSSSEAEFFVDRDGRLEFDAGPLRGRCPTRGGRGTSISSWPT